MIDHVAAAFLRTVSEGLLLFGGVFALAVALWFVSQFVRAYGGGLLGRTYYYIVAPGIVCHETGHALGCIVTRTKILEFVPFRPEGETLGYVTSESRPGIWPQIAQFFISTGPVWFGCAVILILSRLFAGPDFLPSFNALAPRPGEHISVHLKGIWYGAVWMLQTVFAPWRWKTPLFPVFLYLVFCIASEITLSPQDIKGVWRGLAAIVGALFVLNLLPVVSDGLGRGVDALRPAVFTLHVILFFVLLVDLVFLAAMRIVWALLARKTR